MDVLAPLPHGGRCGVIVVLHRRTPLVEGDLPVNVLMGKLQCIQQHSLVLVALLLQQLIEAGALRAAVVKKLSGIQLLPPGPDHGAAAEQRQLGGSDQAMRILHGSHGSGCLLG